MPTQAHIRPDGTRSRARFSPCGTWRYSLTRRWDPEGAHHLWVLLNPSTADAMRNDPTLARIEGRSREAGAGAFTVVNLFAFRTPSPRDLFRALDPVGPGNDAAIRAALRRATSLHCGWGRHGDRLGRAADVLRLLSRTGRPLLILGLTATGAPRHPLYVPRTVQPRPWEEVAH